MKSGKFVVTHHSPMRGRFAQAVFVILVLLVGVGLYHLGQYRAGYNFLQAQEMKAALENSIISLHMDRGELRDKVALIEQTRQVDTQAYEQVKGELRLLQQENLELREEVSFFRGIVSPVEGSAGVRVKRFGVEKSPQGELYHYKFVLTQVLKNDKYVQGNVIVSVDGVLNGEPKMLEFADVTAKKKKKLEFKFRYFQKFSGNFILPKGFVPRQVLIEVNPSKRKTVKASFDWPSPDKLPD